MGKMETVVRSEIARLARREIRPLVAPLARQVRVLARQVKALQAEAGRLAGACRRLEETRAGSPSALAADEQEVEQARMSPGLIRKLRARLNLTQGQLAGIIVVSTAAVQSWEQGIARPSDAKKALLVGLRKLGRRAVGRIMAEKGLRVSRRLRKPRTARRGAKHTPTGR